MPSDQTPDWKRIEQLIDAVMDLTESERDARLQALQATAQEQDLLRRLLDDQSTDDVLERVYTALNQARPDALPEVYQAGQYLDRWQLIRRIGRGGMAEVWLAERRDGELTQQAALKCIRGDHDGAVLAERFAREQAILARLEHPNIARLYDSGVSEDGVAYMVMEYLRGEDLLTWSKHQQLSLDQRLALFDQMLAALLLAHAELVVHLDLKPANVLIDQFGQLKLLDFGIANELDRAARVSDSSYRALTPEYAAPEQQAGEPAGVAADIFALGRILAELVAPARPGSSLGDLRLQAIIDRATARKPAARYASVAELRADLKQFSAQRPISARASGRIETLQLFLRRNWLPVVTSLSITLALVLGLITTLAQAERAEQARRLAEAAHDRADATNRFLTELFEGEIPMVPPDELPTTRQIVDRGIEQARDASSGSNELRADFMLTLAGILIARRQYDDGLALIGQSEALHESGAATAQDQADARIRALWLRQRIAGERGEFDRRMVYLDELLPLLQDSNFGSDRHLQALNERAYLEIIMERPDEAERRFEALLSAHDLSGQAGLKRSVLRNLGLVAARRDDLPRTERYFREAADLVMADPAADLATRAGALHDLGGVQMALADFEQARESFERIVEMMQPLSDRPSQVLAATWSELGRLHQFQGRFDLALDYIAESARQWAVIRGQADPEDDFFIHYHQARILADAERFPEAADAMARAVDLMQRGEEAPVERVKEAQALIAAWRCQAGQVSDAERLIQGIDPDLMGRFIDIWFEANAWCDLAGLQVAPSRAELLAGLATPDSLIPQRRGSYARRAMLRAQLLKLDGETAPARDALREAQLHLEALGLTEHPLNVRARRLAAEVGDHGEL